jgi:endo-chitodextinase
MLMSSHLVRLSKVTVGVAGNKWGVRVAACAAVVAISASTATTALAQAPTRTNGPGLGGRPPAAQPSAEAQAKNAAARFLTQATFGPRTAEINALANGNFAAWIDQQIATPAQSHLKFLEDSKARRAAAAADGKADFREEDSYEAIWQQWLWHNDQLRARMSFALSQIMVISNVAPDIYPEAMSAYMDTLNKHAFSTYRELLEAVTLQPAMGYYLNMMGSEKEDPAKNRLPNENFAREVLQLFSVGLYELNQDGSRKLEATGKPISTYDESIVKGFAQAFTGWNFSGNDTTKSDTFDHPKESWRTPLEAWPSRHSTGTKKLLNGVLLPAGQSPQADMKAALDNIANHPNVGPFVGRQLIQRFVTSNPSPQYIARISAVFENNGRGVRGDLGAVIKAILLDAEARNAPQLATPGIGKQREPVIRFANILRAFNGMSKNGLNSIDYLDSADSALGQSPLLAPSVFNFFSPNYTRPGKLAAAGLVAPEFQITNEIQTIGTANFFFNLVSDEGYGYGDSRVVLNLTPATALAHNPIALVDFLDGLLTYGQLSQNTRNTIIDSLAAMHFHDDDDWDRRKRVRTALTLLVLSGDFVIQK